MTHPLVEIVARELWDCAEGLMPSLTFDELPNDVRLNLFRQARAAILAIEASGRKILEREPTQTMFDAGTAEEPQSCRAGLVWRAMFDAAPRIGDET